MAETRRFSLSVFADEEGQWWVQVPGRCVSEGPYPIDDLRSMVASQLTYALETPEREAATPPEFDLGNGSIALGLATFSGCAYCGSMLPEYPVKVRGHRFCNDDHAFEFDNQGGV